MPVYFYLSSTISKKREKNIYTSITVHRHRYCASIGFSISPDLWENDNGVQHVRRNAQNANSVPASIINARIAAIRSKFEPMEAKMDKSQVSVQFLKESFNALIERSGRSEVSASEKVLDHMAEFLREGGTYYRWSNATMMKMNTFRRHLERFNPDITFDDFTENGLNDYLVFCSEVIEMIDTSVAREFKLLKWFLNWAVEKGYTEDLSFRKFKPKLKETKRPVIFLTKEELKKLYTFEIPASGTEVELIDICGKRYTKVIEDRLSMDKARDLFCFCCFTSLRYSDMAHLKRTDIVKGKIRIVTQKTDDDIEIELNPMAKAILDKYKSFDFAGLALPVISNQKLNQYLKNICELCGFTQPITITQYVEGRRREYTFPKWMVISSHSGRKTFICNALAAGIPPHVVMKWTGHSDYDAMRPYIEVAENVKETEMEKFTNALSI